MMWHEEFRLAILEALESVRARNKKFSVRALGQRLGLSPGAMSEVLGAKRRLSRAKALQVLSALNLDRKRDLRLRRLIDGRTRTKSTLNLSAEQLSGFIKDWIPSAVLHFFELPPGQHEPSLIAKRLGVPEQRISEALDLLLEIGALARNPDGQIHKVEADLTTSDEIPNDIVRISHQECLRLTSEKLADLPIHERDVTATVFAGNRSNLAEAKRLVRRLHEDVETTMERGRPGDIFRLQIQLIPLTQKEKS